MEKKVKVVAIGASAGGPAALMTVLAGLPADFPVPIVVVQHIAPGFLTGLVEWLSASSPMVVEVARPYQVAAPGRVYFAPDGAHLGISPRGVLTLSDAPPEHCVRPSISYLFRTVASNFEASAIGVLLTGMGRDGASELKLMKDRGAYTIAQDEGTSLIHGMPGEAIQQGGAGLVLAIERIPMVLDTLVHRS